MERAGGFTDVIGRLFGGDDRPQVAPADLPTARKFMIFAVMAFGQFLALIDIQIVAASLNDVQAGLSAGPDEISWIQTGYLMAELVMIPFSAFLAQALSTRWLFALSAGLFTLSSALCGAAWDIQSMVLFRVVQGFVGGAMVPTVFATGYALFSGAQRAMIPAILGMVSVLAPTLGPTVGGFLTDAVGWRAIFYINIVPGAAVTVLSLVLIHVDRPNLSMLRRIDPGDAGMTALEDQTVGGDHAARALQRRHRRTRPRHHLIAATASHHIFFKWGRQPIDAVRQSTALTFHPCRNIRRQIAGGRLRRRFTRHQTRRQRR